MPGFHALTGCDTTSSFFGKGKKKAWTVWNNFPEATEAFHLLSSPHIPRDEVVEIVPIIEKFVCRLYGAIENDSSVDAFHCSSLFMRGKTFDEMPPRSDALIQHILRAAYQVYTVIQIQFPLLFNGLNVFNIWLSQAGVVWGSAMNREHDPPSPEGWGWKEAHGSTLVPVYTTLAPMSEKNEALNACKCRSLCSCGGCTVALC
jgi:hypothetical protein